MHDVLLVFRARLSVCLPACLAGAYYTLHYTPSFEWPQQINHTWPEEAVCRTVNAWEN